MSEMEPVTAHVVGLPVGTSLGDLEGIILPRISGRIVAIGLQDAGTAVIEFARMADAGVCRASRAARRRPSRQPTAGRASNFC